VSGLAGARVSIASVRWTLHAVAEARRQLRQGRVDEVTLPPAPATGVGRRAAWLALRLATRNCLVRSLVRQAWLSAAGEPRDVVIGVRLSPAFIAHAWIDGDPIGPDTPYEELLRLPTK
jgi:hypothetical protein